MKRAFEPIASVAAHQKPYSIVSFYTGRTKRSRTSGKYLLGPAMGLSSQGTGPATKRVTVQMVIVDTWTRAPWAGHEP